MTSSIMLFHGKKRFFRKLDISSKEDVHSRKRNVKTLFKLRKSMFVENPLFRFREFHQSEFGSVNRGSNHLRTQWILLKMLRSLTPPDQYVVV